MNKYFASLALAVAFVPAAALAQPAPPPGPMGTPSAQQRAAMEQMHAQMMQMHEHARAQMLASLSAPHRAFVQNVIGQLATAPQPNPQAAAQQIDATLSPGEKTAILGTEANLKATMRNMMAQQRAQFEANMTPAERAKMQAWHDRAPNAGWHRPPSAQDPGTILLRTLSGPGAMGPMHMHMHMTP